MNIKTEIAHIVRRGIAATPPETHKRAADECDTYTFQKAGPGYYVCIHKENAYLISDTGGEVGCSCGDMTHRCHDNEICKHLTTHVARTTPPTAKLDREIAKELMIAGWTGGEGELQPPENAPTEEPDSMEANEGVPEHATPAQGTSDPEGDDNEGSDPTPDSPPTPPENPNPEYVSEDAQKVIGEVEAAGGVADLARINDQLAKMKRFRVTGSEAIRGVVSGILRAQGIKRPKGEGRGTNELAAVETINSDGRWVNLRVKVVDLWHSDHDSIRQIGLVGDETGTTKFVSWEKADLPMIEEGKCYSIENVVTKEFEGSYSVAFNKTTKITEIDEDIEVGYTTIEYTGVLVALQNGSGLIKRCSVCNKAMQKGECKEHGRIEGAHDLRIRAVLDNGTSTQNILLNRERTEDLTGILLDDAIQMAQDALDGDVVAERMQTMLIGQEYAVTGRSMGDTLLLESAAAVDAPITKEMIEELVKEV